MKSILLLTSLFLVSCSLLQGEELAKPKVKVSNVSIQDMSFSETTLGFDLSVDNPNPVSFEVKTLSYELLVGGKKVSAKEQKINKEIAAKKVTEVSIPLTLSNSEFLSTIGELVQKQKTPYKISGTVTLGLIPIPFEKEGVLDVGEWTGGEE